MTLDDVYGADQDEFPLEQGVRDWAEEDLGLEWDETEFLQVATQLGAARSTQN